ncbi:kinesin-associated protein-domain-containing protein [Gorgonomyces haynaldii]|nr:kinesin-associated protein-domain-containing protein [Gorgonomyces haynaldii]
MGGSQDELEAKLYPGSIDVHPTEDAIIVNYTAQAAILGEDGQPVAGDKKQGQKILKQIATNCNIANLAKDIIERCKLIHPSRQAEVEQVLYYLQKRQQSEPESDRAWLRKQLDENQPASMSQIDSYIEGLYEEMKEKITSTRRILELAKSPEHMPQLAANGSLMSALSRVLREDGKRSMELVTNIVYIFFCFSNFSEFHPVITANKIGDMCLKMADQELKRFEIWHQDLSQLEQKALAAPSDKSLAAQLEKEHTKFQSMIRKQDQLLFVSFHVLLNLAEDLGIEVKMIKRDIVKYLVTMLDRHSPELHVLVITFLKKLSVFKENKDEMILHADKLLPKLNDLLGVSHKSLQSLSLKLCLNLSHDPKMRSLLAKHILERIVTMFTSQNYTVLVRMILEYKGERMNAEVMSLAINLSTVPQFQLQLAQDSGLRFLMKRALKTKDPLLLKMLRNISQHPEQQDFIDDMMSLILASTNNQEVLVELLGILGNLVIPEFDFAKLVETYDFLSYLYSLLMPSSRKQDTRLNTQGVAEDDDVLLEVVILIGTMALDENIPPKIAQTQILPSKEEDDEMILQLCYCMHQYLLHDVTCRLLIGKTLVNLLIDLLYDRNMEIRKVCDAALGEIDEDWERKLRIQKFAWHNSEWIGMITQASAAPSENTYGKEDHSRSHSRQSFRERRFEDDTDDEFEHAIGGSKALLYGPY